MEKICEKCGKSFSRSVGYSSKNWNERKFCSHKCQGEFLKGKKRDGYIVSKTTKNKMSLAWKINPKRNFPTGKNHWANKRRIQWEKDLKPKVCELCKKSFTKKPTTRFVYWRKQRFCSRLCVNRYASSFVGVGVNSPRWKGGKSSLNEKVRKIPKMKEWRDKIFKRDDYTCQDCKERGGQLHADHKKALAILLLELGITTLKQARNCKELWKISNGKTLCIKCHEKTETYGGRTLGKTYHSHII